MNKLLMFPLTFMLILSIFCIFFSGKVYSGYITKTGESEVSSHTSEQWSDIEWALYNASFEANARKHAVSLQNMYTVLALLTLAFALAGIAGLKLFGSGLSVFSQLLIFNATLYGGIWACLTLNSIQVIFKDGFNIGSVIWTMLTIFYVLGMAVQINGQTGD